MLIATFQPTRPASSAVVPYPAPNRSTTSATPLWTLTKNPGLAARVPAMWD